MITNKVDGSALHLARDVNKKNQDDAEATRLNFVLENEAFLAVVRRLIQLFWLHWPFLESSHHFLGRPDLLLTAIDFYLCTISMKIDD